MPQIADQALQRRYQFFRDQHNREWGTNVEVVNGMPTGGWSPRFQAPLMPPAKYLGIDERRPGKVTIDYDAWIKDLQAEKQRYIEKGKRYGFEKYGALFDPSKPFSEEVLLFLGPPPRPAEPVIAARQGNRWMLGLLNLDGTEPQMPSKLAPFFIKPQAQEESFIDAGEDVVEVVVEDPPAASVSRVSYRTEKPRSTWPALSSALTPAQERMARARAARAAKRLRPQQEG